MELKDSGARREFGTGAVRDIQEGKGRCDLLPLFDVGLTVHDSIPYKVDVIKEVRKRNGYDRFTSWGFWILAFLILTRVTWWIFKTFYLRK